MNKFFHLFIYTIQEARTHKSYLLAIIIATFFIWLLGSHIDLIWESGHLVESRNSIWFGGEEKDYRMGIFFAYVFVLFTIIFFSSGVSHQNLTSKSLTQWLVKPISRKGLLCRQLISVTLLCWFVYIYLNMGLWVSLGMRYGMWLSGLWSSLSVIFIVILAVNGLVFLMSLITDRSVTSALMVLFIIILIPVSVPLLENNFNLTAGTGGMLVDVLDLFSPKFIENLSEMSRMSIGGGPDFSSLPRSVLFGTAAIIGALFIFERKSY